MTTPQVVVHCYQQSLIQNYVHNILFVFNNADKSGALITKCFEMCQKCLRWFDHLGTALKNSLKLRNFGRLES